MPFVVVAAFIHLMIPMLDAKEDIHFIKRKGCKGYFYYSGDLPQGMLLHEVKKIIAIELSFIYVVDCYGMYKGMMDFASYLSSEKKDQHPYYTENKKELSDEELEAFLQSKGLS